MMEQYLEIKAAHPGLLLFYRMGDFYELFFEDAEIASRALGIMLTKRGKHQGADIPMCGVPVERSEDYLHRLIAHGLPGRGLRADGRPGRREGARRQKRGPARRGAAGDARHLDRGHPARCPRQQLSAGDRTRPLLGGRRPLRARLDRYLDVRVHGDGMRRRRACGRRWRVSIRTKPSSPTHSMATASSAPLLDEAAGGDAADPRRLRQLHRGAAAVRLLRGRDHGRLRRDVAA